MRRLGRIPITHNRKPTIFNSAEAAFASQLEAEGKLYFYQPKAFVLPELETSYTPDFYVIEDKTFYEVIGTRQAFSYQREKIESFRLNYPKLQLEVVNVKAWRNGSGAARKKTVVRGYQRVFLNRALKRAIESIEHPNEIQSLLAEQFVSGRFRSLASLSRHTGIGYYSLRDWLFGKYFAHPDHEQNLRDKLHATLEQNIPIQASRFKGGDGE